MRATIVGSMSAMVMMTCVAQAQESSIEVRGCGWLDVAELTRLVRLELTAVSEPLRAVAIDYACGGDDLTIAIASTARNIRVERRVADACCEDVELERTIAALTVGLLRAAAPVLAGEPAPAPTTSGAIPYDVVPLPPAASTPSEASAPEPSAAMSSAATLSAAGQANDAPAGPTSTTSTQSPGVAAPLASAPPASVGYPLPTTFAGPWTAPTPDASASTRARHEIGAGARVALHQVGDPVAMLGPKVRYRGWALPWLALGGKASASFGSARRAGGEVAARLFQIDTEAAFRLAGDERWSLLATGFGGLAVLQLVGEAQSSDFSAAEVTGATGEIGLSMTPGFGVDRFGFSLPLELGYLFRAPRGLVSGQAPVQIDGMWLGASLVVHVGLGALEEPAGVGALP